MIILVLIGTVVLVTREIFYERISLNSVLLLLVVNFVNMFRLELMHISLIVSIMFSAACSAVIFHKKILSFVPIE